MPEPKLLVISATGDLILDVAQEDDDESFSYRVETSQIRQNSPYFERLLGGRFSEASLVSEKHTELRKLYTNGLQEAPVQQLPRITVVDIGRISKVKNIENITADFLHLLHGHDFIKPNTPIANLANLAVVADRFDSLHTLSSYATRKRIYQTIDVRTKSKMSTEEVVRQKLLVGYLLDYGIWVSKSSRRLILTGSRQWDLTAQEDFESASWWDLPHGIEEELRYRRERVLETVSSIPLYYLSLYMSGERQCKLGYDSSLACDSYQLGEMIKFLSRIGVVRAQSLILDSGESIQYTGEIDRLLENLRKCPNYQIDNNHSHCGLRNRMIPILDYLQYWLEGDSGSPDLGLCVDCFKNRRGEYSWSEAKRPLIWKRNERVSVLGRPNKPSTAGQCSHRQFSVLEMFTATERDWS